LPNVSLLFRVFSCLRDEGNNKVLLVYRQRNECDV
jgi:hypothetical protein